MVVNYIYNANGQIEYAVIPWHLWDKVKEYAENSVTKKKSQIKKKFNPSEFRGILSHYNFDIEQELKNMRDQWTRNF